MDKIKELLKDTDICLIGYERNGCRDLVSMGLNKLHEAQKELEKPSLEDYILALPYLTFKDDGFGEAALETTGNDWAYIPTLYKFEGEWCVDWVEGEDNDSAKVIKGSTPMEATKNAYDWCVNKGFIKDILNYG